MLPPERTPTTAKLFLHRGAVEGLLEKKDGKFNMSQIQKEFPKRINIQTQGGCNARCVSCPSHQVTGKIPMGKMDWSLFKKIVDECAGHDMSRINPFSQNEPLIDKEIAKRVAYIKEKCGDRVTSLVISNGSLLTEQLMHSFIDAGLDRLKISLQGLTRDSYERVMVGLKHDVTYANVEKAIHIKGLHQRYIAFKYRRRADYRQKE